jgi:hypothetical protein
MIGSQAKTYAGKPCVHGHGKVRYVSSYDCVPCSKAWDAMRRETPEKRLAKNTRAEAKARLADAKAQGLKTFLGLPCPRCGNCERYVSGDQPCVACERARGIKKEATEKACARRAAYRQTHRDEARTYHVAYRQTHRAQRRAGVAKRRSLKQMQRCVCCTDEAFRTFYDTDWISKDMGHEPMHVDHIVQIAMGGLDCVHNIRTITQAAHKIKNAADARQRADFRKRARLLKAWCADSNQHSAARS